jgi:hypothetical protein
MSFLLKESIHGTLVDAVYNEIFSRRSNYYYFIGKVQPWTTPTSPDTPLTTQTYEQQTRNFIIATKKIQVFDVSYVVPRIDWTSGRVYDQFDGDYSSSYPASTGATSLKTAQFYVLTTDFNVYKCIFNNNGIPSTSKPTGIDATTTTTADGYIWKYLYTIPLSLRNRFLTEDYMPVQKSVLNPFYSNGEIDRIIIDNYGSGYLGNAEVTLSVNGVFGSGTGNSIANIVPVFNTAGQFVDVIIRNAGNNYVSANILITDNAGTGTGFYNTASIANLIPVLYNTAVDRVLIVDPGINYSSNVQTTAVLTGDGANASLLPFVNEAGEVEDIIIVNRGDGYTFVDIEIVGDGSNANAYVELSTGDLDTNQSTVELAAIDGAIYNFRIINAGDGYSNANIFVSGDGSGFAGTVNISNTNTISSISVTSPGTGYTFANVSITGSGANANLTAIISPVNGHGFNPVKELFADSLMFYSTINNERLHGVDVNNDYRQFGIIKDIKQFANSRAFANVTGTSCYLVTVDTITNDLGNTLAADTILTLKGDTTREFEVVEVVTSNSQVLITNLNNYSLLEDDILNDPDTDSDFTIETIDRYPTINKFTGDMLFIDNRTKVSYSDQQLVTLRTVIKL